MVEVIARSESSPDYLCVKRSPEVQSTIIQEFSMRSPCARENVGTGAGRKML